MPDKVRRWYEITHKESGEQQIVCGLRGYDRKVWRSRRIERAPGEFERIDGRGRIERDEAAEIDARFGAEHIAAARAAKLAEARIILAGVAIDGLVAAEAAVRGVAVDELAATIVAKAEPLAAAEIERISAKAGLQ